MGTMFGNVTALVGWIYIGEIQEQRHPAHMLQACGLRSSRRVAFAGGEGPMVRSLEEKDVAQMDSAWIYRSATSVARITRYPIYNWVFRKTHLELELWYRSAAKIHLTRCGSTDLTEKEFQL